MKKICVFLMTAAFLSTSAITVFAEETAPKEKSLFKIVCDTMKPGSGKEKNKYKKVEKVHMFQGLADGIKEGSAKAKNESLREKK